MNTNPKSQSNTTLIMEHLKSTKILLFSLSIFLLIALLISHLKEREITHILTALETLSTPHSTQVFILNLIYKRLESQAELKQEQLKPLLLDYLNTPDPSFDLFFLPRRENYCQANFLHTLLNPEHKEDYMFMDASNSDKLKKQLNHDFDFLNSLVFRKKEYSKKEIEKLQNMEWSPKIKLFFTRTNFNYNNQIGKSSLCMFQMGSKIPGSSILHRTDLLIDQLNDHPTLIDKRGLIKVADFFPKIFRLYDVVECVLFFETLASKRFKTLMKHRIVYLIKNADHSREDSLDFLEVHKLMRIYKKGSLCGQIKNRNVVQEYYNSQIRFKNGRKFVLRVYMSIISTKPLFVVFHRGVAVLDRFNKYVPFQKAVIDPKTVFEYLRETRTLLETDEEVIYQKIKKVVEELNELARDKYLVDHRFYQTFAFDFILTAKKEPVLVNWSGSPQFTVFDGKFVSQILQAEMALLNFKTARFREFIQSSNLRMLKVFKERHSSFEFLEDFVVAVEKSGELEELNKTIGEVAENPISILKMSDFEGLDVIFNELHDKKVFKGVAN